MIRIENLSKSYGELSVLENISVDIKKGEVISVIGPSGCGKSTFIRCLNLLEQLFLGGQQTILSSFRNAIAHLLSSLIIA